jgi:CheY-like chemotaxis protein
MPAKGSVAIGVRRACIEQPEDELAAGDYVVLSVTDTGEGMPPEVAARAFDPFYTTKPAGRGTGLGLAQVYSLARQSQGSARIESTEGRGTTVSLWLGTGELDLKAEGPVTRGAELGGGERVLLVDDDADVLQAISAMLAIAGYEVFTAASGSEALAMFDHVRPDVLILDFAMPGLDGGEVARRVRAAHAEQAILFVSAQASLESLQRAVPGVRLLRKPFREAELVAAVRRCIASA